MMEWLRVARYWDGEYPEAQALYLPVPCMQCRTRPVRDRSARSTRRITTRTVSTFWSTTAASVPGTARSTARTRCASSTGRPKWEKPLDEQLSPDLTTRSRGVMEKCTFCIQRIRRAKESAADEGRDIRDAEAVPACVQTCPPGALLFGNLADPHSEITRKLKDPRRFRLMEHLGTEPRVVYLKRQKGAGR